MGLDAAVLDAITRAIAAAHAHGREISVCGELAAHPEGAAKLIAAGVSALSVAIPAFARVITLVSEKPEGESS
jgi:phosphoenolpyruvate-protein kinase (PTS system EI component)